MNPLDANRLHLTRRSLFGKSALGLGGAALGSLLTREGFAMQTPDPLAPALPHFAPKAKRVIYLLQNGAP